MPYVKLRARLGADEIRAVMVDKPQRKWRWQKVAINLLEVIGILLILLMIAAIAIAILGPAIDHELDRLAVAEPMHPGGHRPTAESVAVVVEDEPANPDLDLLATLIHAEARGESFEGQVGVGAVVLNRVNDPRWPDTVEAVVLQSGQFATPTEATPEAERAAQEALSGVNPVGDSVYFYNPEISRCGWIVTRETVAEIGNHTFSR